MKRCFKCGRTLPLEEFYPHPQMADGHLGKCKDCACRDARRHRATTPAVQAYDRARALTETRRAASVAHRKQYRATHREEIRARGVVAYQVRIGKLIKQPCAECGALKVEAHHPDHSRPLDVVWLCPLHHRRLEFAKEF